MKKDDYDPKFQSLFCWIGLFDPAKPSSNTSITGFQSLFCWIGLFDSADFCSFWPFSPLSAVLFLVVRSPIIFIARLINTYL